MTVVLSLLRPVGFRRDNCLNIALCQILQHMIGIVDFVCQHSIGFDAFYQCLRMRTIGHLSTSEQAAQRISQRIDCGRDIGAQPTS